MHVCKPLLVSLLLVSSLSGAALAQSGYTLSVADSEDVPERTVTIEGTEYPIDSIAQVTPGEDLRVSVDAPSEDSTYRVRLYDSDMNQIQTRKRTGDETVTFTTDCQDCDPGTYVIGLYEDGELLAVHPAVIAGYDVTLQLPDSADAGDTVEATITVEEGALSGHPHAVEVALGNGGGEELRVDATHESGSTYTASIDTGQLGEGTYTVYAGALSDEYVGDNQDEHEALGISSSHTLEVASADDSSNDDDSGDDSSDTSDGGSGGGETADGDVTETPTPTATETDTGNETATETPTPTATATPTEDSSVITPNHSTKTPTDSDGPAPSVPLVIAVCTSVGLWLRRRSR